MSDPIVRICREPVARPILHERVARSAPNLHERPRSPAAARASVNRVRRTRITIHPRDSRLPDPRALHRHSGELDEED